MEEFYMSQTKKQLMQAALNNQPVERVPVGFWFHYLADESTANALVDPNLARQNVAGHRAFYERFDPDFVKLMSDGYFIYPNEGLQKVTSVQDLKNIRPLGPNHPWIEKQVELVKNLQDLFGDEVLTFYNIFAPARYLEWSLPTFGKNLFGDFIAENKAAFKAALAVVAEDVAALAHRVIKDGGADGIYFSVQNIDDSRIMNSVYKDVIEPGEQAVLAAANEVSDNNILHICGYEGHHNDLSWYTDYNAKAYNWAVKVEDISLEAGKKIFAGKAVIGGFGNTKDDVLYSGTKKSITDETAKILQNTGRTGVILGADCTVPSNIDLKHLEWVRQAAI
jgi:uroporphyrinogen decarboxylase